jgi:hypothetical protein
MNNFSIQKAVRDTVQLTYNYQFLKYKNIKRNISVF